MAHVFRSGAHSGVCPRRPLIDKVTSFLKIHNTAVIYNSLDTWRVAADVHISRAFSRVRLVLGLPCGSAAPPARHDLSTCARRHLRPQVAAVFFSFLLLSSTARGPVRARAVDENAASRASHALKATPRHTCSGGGLLFLVRIFGCPG